MKYSIPAIGLTFALMGCSAHTNPDILVKNQLQKKLVQTETFLIPTYSRFSANDQTVRVYIEGDGSSFNGFGRPSQNPTPKNAVALKLALKDTSPNVVYLARPCFYGALELDPMCQEATYWTYNRFDRVVLDSLLQAAQSVLPKEDINIEVVGFSGGAVFASYFAKELPNVTAVRTIAGNLSPNGVRRYHGFDSLLRALEPMEIAEDIAHIPQSHYTADIDSVVPRRLQQQYMEITGPRCVDVQRVDDTTHDKGWENIWPSLLAQSPTCK